MPDREPMNRRRHKPFFLWRHLNKLRWMTLTMVFAGLVLLPVLGLRLGATDWAMVTAVGWGAAGYLALFSTVLAYVGWYWALARGGVARMGAIQYAQPVVGLALAVSVMGEAMTWPLALAAAAILVGTAVAQRG